MTDIIFVRPRYDYPPYSDLYKLITLSGFPLIHFDQMDVTDASKVYIFSPANGELGDGWPDARARIIHLQLEYEHEDGKVQAAPLHPGVAEKWVCDAWYAEQIGARFVPLGSHPALNLQPDDCPDKVYDVALLQAQAFRRYQIWGELEGYGLSAAPNGWGYARHMALLKSKCMVIVHQHDNFACIAPLRWCLAAAYRLPLISEAVHERAPFGYTHFVMSDFAHLSEFVNLQLKDMRNLDNYGYALHSFLCREFTFRKSVEAAV